MEKVKEVKTEEVVKEEAVKEVKPKVFARGGELAGIDSVADMTDEQLTIEIRNARSNFVKAEKREAPIATIERNKLRLEKAEAERAKRAPVKEDKKEAKKEDKKEVKKEDKKEVKKDANIPF